MIPYVESKRLKAIAVSSEKRIPAQPGLPTLAESGYPGIGGDNWYAFVVPAATPKEIVSKLNARLLAALNDPETRARIVAQHALIIGSTPQELEAYVREELGKWTTVAKAAGIQPE
jgi:tripartite-type tricarboxylate transporter receptor subunit TctC